MQTDVLKNDEAAQKTYQNQLAAYRALRASYMGRTHVNVKRWKEAIVLFEVCNKHRQAIKDKQGFSSELNELLKSMDASVDVEKACAQANLILDTEEEAPVYVPQKVTRVS